MNPFDSGSPRRSNSRRSNSGQLSPRAQGDAAWVRGATGRGSDEINSNSSSLLLCDVVAHDVAAYFDGEADDEAALRARRHLDACSGCARMWRDWGDARLLLRTAALPEMPVHWPASLIQRARLQAMLPALFVPQTGLAQPALDEHSQESSVVDVFGTAPPRELREAILARTTRVAEAKPAASHPEAPPQARAAAFEPVASGPVRFKPVDRELSGGSLLRARRYRLATRACASALAAWMLVLASVPAPQAPPQGGGPASTASQHGSEPSQAEPPASSPSRLAALPSRRAAPVSSGRASSELLIEKAQPGTRPALVEDDTALPGAASRASRWASDPSTAESVVPAPRRASSDESIDSSRESAASVDAGGGSALASRASSQPALEAPRQLAPRAWAAGHARPLAPAPDPVPALAATPRSSPIRSASTSSGAVAPIRRRADSNGEAGDAASSRAEEDATQDAAGAQSPRDGAEPAPLALDRELNDARPTEVSDAVDAYAATWLDEGEGSLE